MPFPTNIIFLPNHISKAFKRENLQLNAYRDSDHLWGNNAKRELSNWKSLVQMEIPQTLTTKEEILAQLYDTYQAYYQLTNITPFIQESLLSHFVYKGDTCTAQDTLNNHSPHLVLEDKNLNDFLNAVKYHDIDTKENVLPATISLAEYKVTFSQVGETKSSSLSKSCFSIYKAIDTDAYLCKVKAHILSLLYVTSYAPTRWKTAFALMIPKETNTLDPGEKQEP